jgi:hypothetical protein
MRQKLPRRLPQLRVSEYLFTKVQLVAKAQELDISDVQRLALEDYCTPHETETVAIPIIGEIKDNHVVFYPGFNLSGKRMLLEQSRYLEVEPVGG